ncbi:DNA-binding protein [Streptomyces inhibens]|uniref:DNA-binding protein n=1 Tax=Streptomyces inhibens TaxID=2293571 RepID=A0A371Q0U8_STRIH|nr:DNA-binding protein [Streptomyces inhibens]
MTAREAAELAGISSVTVYSWVRRGHLKVGPRSPRSEALPASGRRDDRVGHPGQGQAPVGPCGLKIRRSWTGHRPAHSARL